MSIPDLEEPQQEVVLDDDAVEARSDDENRDNLLALEPDEEAIERVQKQPPRYASLEDFHFLPTELKCITDGGPGECDCSRQHSPAVDVGVALSLGLITLTSSFRNSPLLS